MEASDVKNASTHASADDVQLPESVSAALQYELAEADRTVQETLAEVWSRWCSPPISLANHTQAELVPAFENYAERILRARAGALMQVIDTVPEYLKTVEQVAIPHTIDLIVPHYSLPDSLLQTRDLGAMRIDCRPDGFWEQWIHSTWNLFKEKEGLTSELDIVVLIQFQWVLRFPANREPWVRRMLAHLSGSIPTLKAQAWKVKLDQSLGRHSVADSRVTERVFQARAIDASVAEQPVKQSMGIEPIESRIIQ
jgi:hypothetical protein